MNFEILRLNDFIDKSVEMKNILGKGILNSKSNPRKLIEYGKCKSIISFI